MTIYNDPTAPMFRRAKSVISRDLSGNPPDQLPSLVEPTQPPARAIAMGKAGDVPVLDPTRYSQRKRKRGHVVRYRLAELTTGLSFVATIAGIVCLALGDRQLGQLAAAVAVLLGVGAMGISWPTRLSSRVLGYATAATIVALVGLTVSLALPASWFEEPSPDKPVNLQPTRAKRPA